MVVSEREVGPLMFYLTVFDPAKSFKYQEPYNIYNASDRGIKKFLLQQIAHRGQDDEFKGS